MSILDFSFTDSESFLNDLKKAVPLRSAVVDFFGMTDDVLGCALHDGISPHIALGLSDEHLEAAFTVGLDAMQAGEVDKAQAVFLKLVTLKSIEERFWYALGTTLQLQERVQDAARAYIIALGLRATDVEGYLRLGECLLSARELRQALEVFQFALALCESGHGNEGNSELSNRYISIINHSLKPDGAM